MDKRLINYDPLTGKKTHWTVEDGQIRVTTEVNTDAVTNHAKRAANDWQYGSMIGNTQKHKQRIGEIPAVIYHHLVQKFGTPAQNPKAWKKWLTDNPDFRTTGGNL